MMKPSTLGRHDRVPMLSEMEMRAHIIRKCVDARLVAVVATATLLLAIAFSL